MDRLSSLTLGDITAGLGRYRPAVLTALVILLLAVFLPGDRPGPSGELAGASAPPPVRVASGAAADAADSSAAAPADPSSSATTAPFDSGSTFALQPSGNFGGSSNSATTFHGDEDAAAPDAPLVSSPGFGSGSGSGSGSGASAPLRVVASLYATNGAGTPLATQDVPEGSLPVGKRLGQEDKRSYVRLSGTTPELRLAEATSGNRSTGNSVVSVQACRVTQGGWAEARGVAFSAAPAYDSARCVKGLRATDGLWEFDLSAWSASERIDSAGFALVFAPDAGVDFQVNLTAVVS